MVQELRQFYWMDGFFILDKVVKLVGGGSLINGAYTPSSFHNKPPFLTKQKCSHNISYPYFLKATLIKFFFTQNTNEKLHKKNIFIINLFQNIFFCHKNVGIHKNNMQNKKITIKMFSTNPFIHIFHNFFFHP